MGKTVTITLLSAEEINGEYTLHLKDTEGHTGDNNITSQANPGDFVKWEIETGSNIDRIDNIYAKTGSIDVFSEGPRLDENDTWIGKVDSNARGSESYNIQYTVGSTTIVDDPILEVDPPE